MFSVFKLDLLMNFDLFIFYMAWDHHIPRFSISTPSLKIAMAQMPSAILYSALGNPKHGFPGSLDYPEKVPTVMSGDETLKDREHLHIMRMIQKLFFSEIPGRWLFILLDHIEYVMDFEEPYAKRTCVINVVAHWYTMAAPTIASCYFMSLTLPCFASWTGNS